MTCRVLFSSPFCCGKTSIIEMLERDYGIPKVIDDTTRKMRPNERPGYPYNFLSEEAFKEREKSGYYFETITFNGYRYGAPKKPLFENPRWALDILSKSCPEYRKIPDVIDIYLIPPPVEELKRRARLRGDSEEKIQQRIEALKEENPSGFKYYIQPQESLEKTYEIVKSILKLNPVPRARLEPAGPDA